MNIFAKILFFSLMASPILGAPIWPNLEKMEQNFVLETKQIHIPDYEDAFNPSIVHFKGKLLLSFRTRSIKTGSTNPIGFIYLDEDFEPISEPQIIEFTPQFALYLSFAQDPRLICINDELLMVYSNIATTEHGQMRRVFISKLKEVNGKIHVESTYPLIDFQGSDHPRQEKNWTPFEYNGELLLSYSLSPHRVLKPLEGITYCETIHETKNNISWNWGELRGGTQAFLQDNGEYLGFFHSSKDMKTSHSAGEKISHYFIGAYTFSSSPPFEITAISPEPIIAKGFYSPEKEYSNWKPLRVVFPGGYIFDEKNIWIVYGRQDFELWVVKLDKNILMNSLIPVNSKETAL